MGRSTLDGRDPRRAFDPRVLRRAHELASAYRLTFERNKDVGFLGSSVEMPGVMADGKTLEECADNATEALVSAVATVIEAGERPPSPASDHRRDVQLNIRLTPDERQRLEEAARREGFRSISDFVRTSALARAK